MPPIFYLIPVVVVILLIVIAMPFMKKKAAEAGRAMEAIKNTKLHVSMAAGILNSVNGQPAEQFNKAGTIYGIDLDGDMDIEFTPYFASAGITYKCNTSMHVQFHAQEGKSYEMVALPKKPGDESNVLDVREIKSDEIIFKSTFYIVTKDVTETQGARAMRGAM